MSDKIAYGIYYGAPVGMILFLLAVVIKGPGKKSQPENAKPKAKSK